MDDSVDEEHEIEIRTQQITQVWDTLYYDVGVLVNLHAAMSWFQAFNFHSTVFTILPMRFQYE